MDAAAGYTHPLPANPSPADELANALTTSLEGFLCPSDSVDDQNFHRGSEGGDSPTSTVALAGDGGAAISGTGPGSEGILVAATSNYVAANNVQRCHGQILTSAAFTGFSTPQGAYCSFTETSLGRMADGTSNTIVFGERVYDSFNVRDDGRPNGGALMYVTRGVGNPENYDSGITDVAASAWGGVNLTVSTTDQTLLDDIWARRKQGLASRHSGGVNVARGDGSVAFMRDTISTWYQIDSPLDDIPPVLEYEALEKAFAVADGLPAEDLSGS